MSNPITLEIFRHLFASIAEEMGVRLMRSACSPNIKERRDYSCAIFDASGNIIAQAAHIPVHLGATPMSVRAVLDKFPAETMSAGEQYILNDPFAGGTHLPDITVVAPIIFENENKPWFFVANRAHHADVGGISPGSMPLSQHIDEEGIRIKPQKLTEQTIEWICSQVRTPIERKGDLRAQMAALHIGRKRLLELCDQYGIDKVVNQAQNLQVYTARIMTSIIQEMPDGEYFGIDYMEDDGFGTLDIAIRCKITILGANAVVDFTDSDNQVKGPVNAVRAIAVSAVNYVFRCLAPAGLPTNSGVMRNISVLTKSGTLVDANYPAAVAGGNVETSQRITDVVFATLSKALPDIIPATSCGSMNNITIGGYDPFRKKNFAYYETLAGGAGASPSADGGDAIHTHMTNTLNTPVEALENAYPFRIEEYQVRENSGGKGKFNGGNGMIRTYHFLCDAEVTLLTERRRYQPWGLAGGQNGAVGENLYIQLDGQKVALPAKINLKVSPGDKLMIKTPAGGGYGEVRM